jgi:tetratricopeptide (TPR) repeat protein
VKQKSQNPIAGNNTAKAPVTGPGNRRLIWGICIFLAVIVWVVFGQERGFDFVNFDDGQYVSDNPAVTAGVTAHGVVSAFGARATDNWVPLTTISHMVDCQFYGLNAGEHHLTNVLLHMAAVILLFLALVKLTGRPLTFPGTSSVAPPPLPSPPVGEREESRRGTVLRKNIWRCAFVAAVFAVHPLRAESVAWVSERKDVLCGVFFMLTLWCYAGYAKWGFGIADCGLRNGEGKGKKETTRGAENAKGNQRQARRLSYVFALVFAACALMSKPVAVTLPFVLLLLDYWPLGRFGNAECEVGNEPSPHEESRTSCTPSPLPSPPMGVRGEPSNKNRVGPKAGWMRALVLEKVPFLVLSIVACLPTILTEKQGITATTVVPIPLRIENAIVSYVTYIGEFFYPTGLAAFYYYPIRGLPFREVATAFVFLAAITVAVVLWRRKRPYLLVGWFWYGIMMVPVIGFVQVGSQAHADRHTYFSEIGLCLLLMWLAADLCGRLRHSRLILGGSAAVILLVLMSCGYKQVSYWQNSEALWRHAIECDRYDVRAYYNLANFLYQKEDLNGAITNFEIALEIDPGMVGAHNNLGMAFLDKGDQAGAVAQYRAAIKLDSDYAVAHYNLGSVLLKLGKTDEAIAEFKAALTIDPAHSELRNNSELALPEVTAKRIKTNYAQFHDGLGSAYEGKTQIDEAIEQYQEALKLDPNYSQARYNLANALLKKGEVDQGVAQYQEAFKNDQGDAKSHNNLGTALRREGRVDDAIVQYQEALKIDPDYAPAHFNFANALLQKGEVNSAIAEYQAALKLKPDNVMVQRNIAHTIWPLATSPDAAARNGSNAVAFASEANETTGGTNALILRVLAAATAECGNFPKAIEMAKQALAIATEQQNPGLETALKKEISGYQANSPVRANPQDMSGWQ